MCGGWIICRQQNSSARFVSSRTLKAYHGKRSWQRISYRPSKGLTNIRHSLATSNGLTDVGKSLATSNGLTNVGNSLATSNRLSKIWRSLATSNGLTNIRRTLATQKAIEAGCWPVWNFVNVTLICHGGCYRNGCRCSGIWIPLKILLMPHIFSKEFLSATADRLAMLYDSEVWQDVEGIRWKKEHCARAPSQQSRLQHWFETKVMIVKQPTQ